MSDSPPVAGSLRLPSACRLRSSREFQRVMKEGRRSSDALLSLWILPNGLPLARFGLVVSRRHGGAVQRNRIRRRLREAFRLARSRLPAGWDIACQPRLGADVGVAAAVESLVRLAARIARIES